MPSPGLSPPIALSLGSNLDRPEERLRQALAGLRDHLCQGRPGSLYRSRPVSAIPQPDFLNVALVARTYRSAEELLAIAKALERRAGRRRDRRDGPRPLDIDLLLWGDACGGGPELTLPHPRLSQRWFYLAPLAELQPAMRVPPGGETVAELMERLDQPDAGSRVAWSGRPPEAW